MTKTIYQKIQDQKEKAHQEIAKVQEEYKREEAYKNLNKELEANLYKEFKRIAKGKDFVDIDQIEALGVYYDILIITSIKNTGKSVGIGYKIFNRYYEQGKKIIFMRSSLKELIDSKAEYNNAPSNPFIMTTVDGTLGLVHKKTGEQVGIAKDFKFCNSGSGGEFEGYGAIVYDEFMSWDRRKTINQGHCLNWAALISSVTRNKKEGLKVYCLGNLTGSNTELLTFYGINRDDDLRYIKRYDIDNPDNVCHILYINTNDIYPGIKTQVGAANSMSPEIRAQLYQNKGRLNNMSVINPSDWDEMIGFNAFIVVDPTGQYKFLFELKRTRKNPYVKEPVIYAVRCRNWSPLYNVNMKVSTEDHVVKSTYDALLCIKGAVKNGLLFLHNLIRSGLLFFYDVETQDLLINLFNKSDFIKNRQSLIF